MDLPVLWLPGVIVNASTAPSKAAPSSVALGIVARFRHVDTLLAWKLTC